MHDHHPEPQTHEDTAVKEYEIVARFPSGPQAQHAERAVQDQAKSTAIQQVENHPLTEAENADMGISTVEIGAFAWAGLVVGIILGGILGAVTFSGTVTLPGIAPAMGAGITAVIFLGAGILGAMGWFIGALLHLWRNTSAASQHELHAVVEEKEWKEVGQTLVDAGAEDVLVSKEHLSHVKK